MKLSFTIDASDMTIEELAAFSDRLQHAVAPDSPVRPMRGKILLGEKRILDLAKTVCVTHMTDLIDLVRANGGNARIIEDFSELFDLIIKYFEQLDGDEK